MSFLSPDPQSRLVLENNSKNLLARFEDQSGIVANRYLAFFQERRSIEITYANSLRKLHSKAETIDTSFDLRAEPTTTRAAWHTVRDNLKREVDTQQAFVDVLDNDVIKPLMKLKESNDQTRARIEKDLNGSAAHYANYAESKISELQNAYLKRYHSGQDTHSAEVAPNKRFGGRVSTLFRGPSRREDASSEPAISDEVFDNDCRGAVTHLNHYRSRRVEHLGDGYDCLEELVLTPIVKDALVKYMDGMVMACASFDSLANRTKEGVVVALAGTDTSNLKAKFRVDLSYTIPPLTLYNHKYRPGAYLIFGFPLVDVTTSEDNVPKVMRMCIDEIEKRGLNTKNIYSPDGWPAKVREASQELQHRFENEISFSFTPTDNIRSIAMLLELFLHRLPEPLFTLSLRDYRQYGQNRARHTEDGFPLLRSKILDLHPVHRASLGALSRHLLRVASHSDENAMSVMSLAALFRVPVLRGNDVLQGGVSVKNLVMEDLIQNAQTLFDEPPSLSGPVPSPNVAEIPPTFTYDSSFSSPELPQQVEVEALGSTTRHGSGVFGGILTPTQSSSSSSPTESRLTPPTRTILLSPLPGFPSSKTSRDVKTTTQKQAIPEGRDPKAVETLENSTPAEVMSVSPTSVDEWRLQVPQSQLSPHPEAMTIPQSPPGSVLYSASDFPYSSATSLQAGTEIFSP